MSEYPNSGILFRNQRKEEGSKQPDANGKCAVTCPHCKKEIELQIAGWIREGKSGRFTSLKFEEPRERKQNHNNDTPY